MTYGLTRLTPARMEVLRKLATDNEIGVVFGDLTGHEVRSADYLVDRGLAQMDIGWQLSLWYRLTERGWELLKVSS